ncbi:acyl-CoA dehydrogenase [Rhodococcus sp. 14-2496-1d]|uniref:acyl-CoA dehydrogenase family protein n=1 Tax=Rhodococcus sp. 14-2496-1d TaxID=2023146 RepID=UPI000B9AE2D1|nr:acyl-CoA dehydrogenase family protein [Rhodococcus sp. 14-2496-1d]OZF25684.1 acyl-CoA dehydrogenase [Rhodococcus sp. 14-2496-1d]
MNFEISDDHKDIRQAVAALGRRFPDNYWMEKDQKHEFPTEFYEAFADGGWLGVCVPEEYGGMGMGITEASIILEEVAASGGAVSACTAVHGSIFGLEPVIKFGDENMKREVLPRIVDGSLHVAFSVTEPDAGLDTTRITTFARRDGDKYIVNGRKIWTSKALESEKVLLLTRTTKREDVEKPHQGMTLFLTDLKTAGVEMRAIHKMGRHAVSSAEIFIDDMEIPVEHRVGEEGRGFYYLLNGLNPERMLVAASALGIGRVALKKAAAYANQRVVFGRPIGMNQGIQFPLAKVQMELDAAEMILRKATWLYDNDKECGREANTAKYLCAAAAFEATDRAVQTHGGMGYSAEYAVERYFREARMLRITPVSEEMILNYIGQHVLGLPRSY